MLIHLEHPLFRKCIINYDLNYKTTKKQYTMNHSESKNVVFPKNIFNRHKLWNICFPDLTYLETKSENVFNFICFYFHHMIK